MGGSVARALASAGVNVFLTGDNLVPVSMAAHEILALRLLSLENEEDDLKDSC